VREDGDCFFLDVSLVAQDLDFTFQLPIAFLLWSKAAVARKGVLAFLYQLPFPAVQAAIAGAQFAFDLCSALAAHLP
jgi:hypothetical protein